MQQHNRWPAARRHDMKRDLAARDVAMEQMHTVQFRHIFLTGFYPPQRGAIAFTHVTMN